MGARVAGVQVVVACVLGALAAIAVTGDQSSVTAALGQAGAVVQEEPSLSGAVVPRLPALARLSETVRRPLFSSTRRPPEAASVAAPQPVAQAPEQAAPVPTAKLSAIIMIGESRFALLSEPGGKSPERKREGDSIQGWTIAGIDGNRILLEQGANRHELPLRTFQAAPPPPRRKPKVSGSDEQAAAPRTSTGRRERGSAADEVPALGLEDEAELLEDLEEEAERVREAIERRRAQRARREQTR